MLHTVCSLIFINTTVYSGGHKKILFLMDLMDLINQKAPECHAKNYYGFSLWC